MIKPSPLTSKQRARLRGLAQTLKPVLHIGKEGVTPELVAALLDAFNTRELLKIRVLDTAPASAAACGRELVAAAEDAQIVQVIGRVLVLYRKHPEWPRIELPR